MSEVQLPWVVVGLVIVPVVILVTLRFGRHWAQPTPRARAAWLLAASTSGAMLLSIAAEVVELVPNATVVDVAALVITGVLTGVFLALGWKPAARGEVN